MVEGSRTDGEPRHGFLVDEVCVLIPRATQSQYLPGVTVFPVPRATPRLRGLVHWRGQGVVAIDVVDQPSAQLPVIGCCDLLLIGHDDNAIALLQGAPPQVVRLADVRSKIADAPTKPLCWLSDALLEPRMDENRQVWWELDMAEIAQRMHSSGQGKSELANPND